MNLAVIIPIYKRHDLTRLCFEHLKIQQDKFGFDVFIAGSEGSVSRLLAEGFGFNYIEVENNPLGAKFNSLLSLCVDHDGVVVLGSDDFLPDRAWKLYYTLDMSKKKIYGFAGCYFYSTKRKTLNLFQYKGSIKTIGAGRLYNKATLDAVHWKLWTDTQPRGLDTDAMTRCLASGCSETILDQVTLIDVKHSHNITSHAIAMIGSYVDSSIIERDFGKEFTEKLNALNYSSGNDQIKISLKKKVA